MLECIVRTCLEQLLLVETGRADALLFDTPKEERI